MDATVPNSREETSEVVPLDPAVTKKLFLEWRSPRPGGANPERMNNPVWEWLIKTRISAFHATDLLKGPDAMEAGPGWCFSRFGQSSNQLPDGRVVFIAGEHEDSYDPDFYIYNDVVVQHPDGRLDVFGYPRNIFPPTDFHSATLVSNQLILIGNLGYPDQRRPRETQVMILDLQNMAFTVQLTSGTPPGWIHGHKAELADDGRSILVQHGKLDRGDEVKSLVENIDDWRLHLNDWRWERLTGRRWPRWEVRRKDGEMNHFFGYQTAVWEKQMPELGKTTKEFLQKTFKDVEIPTLTQELGKAPDLELFARRYRPAIAHESMPPVEDEHGVHRIRVAGVTVRYVEEMTSVQMTVEGDLPEPTLNALTRDLVQKMSALENAPCELNRF